MNTGRLKRHREGIDEPHQLPMQYYRSSAVGIALLDALNEMLRDGEIDMSAAATVLVSIRLI